jgi:hypothetical protein
MTRSAIFEPHPVRGRFNAGFFTAFDRPIDRQSRDRKRKIFSGLPPEVVEVGPGVGANLRYMPPGCRVIASTGSARPSSRPTPRLPGGQSHDAVSP